VVSLLKVSLQVSLQVVSLLMDLVVLALWGGGRGVAVR
jgi:hypothetical protein